MMLGLLALMLSAQPAPAALKVAVLPLGGDASRADRDRGAALLIDALRGLEPLQVIALADVAPVLGTEAAQRLEACSDDPCALSTIQPLGADRVVRGEILEPEGSRARLQLRLLSTSTTSAPVLVRVSRDLEGALRTALAREIPAAVAELFPELAARGLGTLLVRVDQSGAAVIVDGHPVGIAPLAPLRLSVGTHRLRVEARGHQPHERDVVLVLGRTEEVRVDLVKRRSEWPLILGAGSAGTAAIGLFLGLSASSVAKDWERSCGSGECPRGYTRERWEEDDSSVSLKRNLANGLFITAGALATGALIWYLADPGMEAEAP